MNVEEQKIKIDELKARIKEAKQANKAYSVVADLESELRAVRNQNTLMGAYANMRKAQAKVRKGDFTKANLMEALRKSIKEIEALPK